VHTVLVGFGLGFLVAVQLGPMSLFLIRSTLRRGWAVGLAVGAGIALGSATWVTVLASAVAIIRRAAGPRAVRAADTVAGVGLVGFGGALAYGAVHDR
jgi:threonine/homoserine/homoserine lactone efflux protein